MTRRRRINRAIKRIIDVLFAIPIIPSALLLKFIRTKRIENFPLCRRLLRKIGVFPVRDHYYEPLIRPETLRYPLSMPRELPGIDWNTDEQLSLLDQFHYAEELRSLEREQQHSDSFQFDNESFCSGDFEYWYSIVRCRKPRKIVEIGSGNSTLLARRAIARNREESADYSCEHICIEPYEWPILERLGVKVVRKRVEDVDLELFRSLRRGDILFIDSSHMVRPQGDVLFEILRVLPILASGVIVHVHDIFSPRDYLDEWIHEQMLFWNEQYLLEAFLTNNHEWRIIGALNFLHHNHFSDLKSACIYLSPERQPGSIYLEKN